MEEMEIQIKKPNIVYFSSNRKVKFVSKSQKTNTES